MSAKGNGSDKDSKVIESEKATNNKNRKKSRTVSISMSGILVAIGVLTSYAQGVFVIPVGPAKIFPVESIINVIAGVMLGPWYAVVVAFLISTLRISLGTGSIFAYPGSIPGALLVGLLFRYVWRNPAAGFIEILGTGIIGSFLSTFLVGPLIGAARSWPFFLVAFIPPAVIGSVIGYLILLAIKTKVRRRIGLQFP